MPEKKIKGKTGQTPAHEKRQEFIIAERRREVMRLYLDKPKGQKPRSVREIGELLGVSRQTVCNDINAEIAALQEETAVDVKKEFTEQLRFAKKLRQAAEDYLSSDTDPMKLVLIPRADEIDIAYYDFADTTAKGEPKKKTATLHALLAKVEGGLNAEADKITIRHVDMRKFALDAVNTTDTCIDKFAKLGGDYMKEKLNPADNLTLAKKVIEDAVAKGMEKAEAVKRASERYGILESELIDVR